MPGTTIYEVPEQVGGRTVRVTLGKASLLGPEQARKLALKTLSEMAQGANPNLSCLITDFASINEYTSRPRQMKNLEEGLRTTPRWLTGRGLSPATDVWGLGMTLVEALTYRLGPHTTTVQVDLASASRCNDLL